MKSWLPKHLTVHCSAYSAGVRWCPGKCCQVTKVDDGSNGKDFVDRILNNIWRSSSVSLCWLCIACCLLQCPATTTPVYMNILRLELPHPRTIITLVCQIFIVTPLSSCLVITRGDYAMWFECFTLLILSGHPSLHADLSLDILQIIQVGSWSIHQPSWWCLSPLKSLMQMSYLIGS